MRRAIVLKVSDVLNEYYVFPEVAKKMGVLIQQKLKNGGYDQMNEMGAFTYQLAVDLYSVSSDRHVRVFPYERSSAEGEKPDVETQHQQLLANWRKDNFGFRKVELLDGNIGYVDFRGFIDSRDSGPTAIAAMNFVAYCDALIIDLRQNNGGQVSLLQLICSYFFAEPKHLNTLQIRKGDISEQNWSQVYVNGPRMDTTLLFLLISEDTFSAAEEMAYDLQAMRRATIVGDTSRGGAHAVEMFDFPEELITIHVPFARSIHPITKSNWEGIGVIPDIVVSSPEAYHVAWIEALKRLKAGEKDEKVKHGYDMIIEEVETRRHPVILDTEKLSEYVGDYGLVKARLVKRFAACYRVRFGADG
jgi:hypothetical protein